MPPVTNVGLLDSTARYELITLEPPPPDAAGSFFGAEPALGEAVDTERRTLMTFYRAVQLHYAGDRGYQVADR